VKAAGSNVWDTGINIRSSRSIKKGDVILVVYWAKQTSSSSELKVFAENSSTFAKEIYFTFNLSPDWTQYFAAFESSADYEANGLTLGFHIGAQIQQFQMGGFTALNLGQIDLNKAPSTFSPAFYGGYESDAPWRREAEARIENIRKKDLIVKVVDAQGNPVSGASVGVEMQKHEFGFGSALVGCRFPGNRCYDETYLEKVLNLDGHGHGFNVAVTENALKWDGWEEQWIGTPDETVAAIQWLNDQGIITRGHTLIWPGWDHMPDDMRQQQNDPSYLVDRINGRLEEMLLHPVLSTLVTEWDVLNEITQVRDLEMALAGKQNYITGREIYGEIFSRVASLQPEFTSYINDYVVLSGGGAGNAVIERYKLYLEELVLNNIKFDGIGFQAHIGTQPTSINKVEEVLDEFYDRYGKRIKITEYDINDNVDENTQANYLADFLTMVFSHPGVDAFLMWGFWDGNHWKNNAPLFNQDWTIKPSGQAFIDKVFNEWWTQAEGQTDADGNFKLRVFKGEHKISVLNSGEVVFDTIVKSSEADTLVLAMTTTSTLNQFLTGYYEVFPNPTLGKSLNVNSLVAPEPVDLHFYTPDGRHVKTLRSKMTGSEIALDLLPGTYFTKIVGQKAAQVSKIIILN
jgi:GH35 family endo-1,4-beta-xylanase